jgi:hypothetical protein
MAGRLKGLMVHGLLDWPAARSQQLVASNKELRYVEKVHLFEECRMRCPAGFLV